jgi:uncharacterized cupin superfamily protein
VADVAAGTQATPLHAHGAQEELFYVLEGGGAAVTEGGEAAELRPGDAVLRRAGGRAHAFVAGPDGLRFLAMGERTKAEVSRLPRTRSLGSNRAWWRAGDGTDPFSAEAALGPLDVPAELTRPRWLVAAADVEARPWGGDAATGADLGRALGSETTGLKLVRMPPGVRGVTKHCHSGEEELFHVLEGDGWFEIGDERHDVRAGHLVARPAGTGMPHTYGAGPGGMAVLAYGQRDTNDMTFYPDSGVVSLRGLGVRFRVEQVEGA